MSEVQTSGTKPKKMVSRDVAIALGIVGIILLASLGLAFAYYSSYVNSYNGYVHDHHYSDDEYAYVLNQSTDLAGIVNLHNQETWFDSVAVNMSAAGGFWATGREADYAGYVWFQFQGPTSNVSIYVRGVFNGSTNGASVPFGQNVDLMGATSTFIPILPDLEGVQFGMLNNGNQRVILNVTITYYY